MLISAWSGSTSTRRSSLEHASFFFDEVQLHLEPADLLKQRVPVGVGRCVCTLARPPVYEQLLDMIERCAPPMSDLHGMHSKLRPQLVERLLAADRFDRHPCLELCR